MFGAAAVLQSMSLGDASTGDDSGSASYLPLAPIEGPGVPPAPGPAYYSSTSDLDSNGDLVGVASNLAPEPFVYQPAALFPTTPNHDELRQPATVVEAASARINQEGGSLTEEEMRHVLEAAGWPTELHSQALAVSWCESRWSIYATNGVDNGLFGMSSAHNATLRGGWLTYWGFAEEQTFDPVVNATAARWTWERSGWAPWSCRTAVR